MKYLLCLGILIAAPVLWLRGGLFQEPVTTALLAARLEVSRADWFEIAGGNEVILRAQNLKELLSAQEADGWTYSKQLGSGHVFVRGDNTEIVTCRMYSTRFRICTTRSSDGEVIG